MGTASTEKDSKTIEVGDHENELCAGRRKLSEDCHDLSSPLISSTDYVEEEYDRETRSLSNVENVIESSSEPPTTAQSETVEYLLSHKDLLSIATLDKVVFNSEIAMDSILASGEQNQQTSVSTPYEEQQQIASLADNKSNVSNAQVLDSQADEEGTDDYEPITSKSMSRDEGTKSSSGTHSTKSKQAGSLRRGKWTAEEETYVARVIKDFNSGYLDAPAGTTLRTYLSEKLKCDPMRITKKFTGEACIGKRVFHPAVRSLANSAIIDKAQTELDALERRWRRRLEMQQRESVKKSAASVAIVAAASSGNVSYALTSVDCLGSNDPSDIRGNPVAKTASWLDRAKNVLSVPSGDNSTDEQTLELEKQMQEVQRLIHEGPGIQQTSQVLPQILDQQDDVGPGSCVVGSPIGDEEPADKRLRTAEDAEALVGFLRSVRASAAQGATF